MNTVEEIGDSLFGIGINSVNRLPTMLRLIGGKPAAIFWPVFLNTWPCCDGTWQWRTDLLFFLRLTTKRESARNFFNADAVAFFDDLPDPVTIYRGCSRSRVRGVSWTTNQEVATGFARGHRGISVPDPVLLTASIPKEFVFSVFTHRSESEVVVDPRRLRRLAHGNNA